MQLLRFRLWQLATAALTFSAIFGAALMQATGTAAAQPRTASQVLAAALAGARSSGSFQEIIHYVQGSHRISFHGEVGTGTGSQQISRSDGARAQVRVTGGAAYVAGNQVALVNYFGFTERQAAAIGERWVSLVPSDSGFKGVAADVTVQTSLPEITLKGHLTEGRKSIVDGQAVIGINGAATLAGLHGTATLYITRTSHPLPVMLEMRQTGGGRPVRS